MPAGLDRLRALLALMRAGLVLDLARIGVFVHPPLGQVAPLIVDILLAAVRSPVGLAHVAPFRVWRRPSALGSAANAASLLAMEPLRDSWEREIKSLRVSVTDKCNFRCRYCMPAEGLEWLGRDEVLSFEEIERLVRVLATMGVDEVRLTGGEPL